MSSAFIELTFLRVTFWGGRYKNKKFKKTVYDKSAGTELFCRKSKQGKEGKTEVQDRLRSLLFYREVLGYSEGSLTRAYQNEEILSAKYWKG
jgi:hypothetical protein